MKERRRSLFYLKRIAERERFLVVGFKFAHHNRESGYDEVKNYFDSNVEYIDLTRIFNLRNHKGSVYLRALGAFLGLLCELWIALIAHRYRVVHFLYAENLSFLATIFIRKVLGVHVLLSHHLDPLQWPDNALTPAFLWRRSVQYATLNICLTDAHAARFSSIYENAKVTVIPHGMHPSRKPALADLRKRFKSRKIIVSGSNYRDFQLLKELGFLLKKMGFSVECVGVPKEVKEQLIRSEGIVVHNRLSEAEYFNLLNECVFMCLPITYATANNALLESFSAGLPCILSRDASHGIDYILEDLKADHSAVAFSKTIERILGDGEESYCELCYSHWSRGIEFCDWSVVAEKMKTIYRGLPILKDQSL